MPKIRHAQDFRWQEDISTRTTPQQEKKIRPNDVSSQEMFEVLLYNRKQNGFGKTHGHRSRRREEKVKVPEMLARIRLATPS